MKKLKVLIVDDEPIISDFIKIRLATEAPHFSISQVESGYDCLQYLKENQADCILSDFQMPGMDGMELLKRLRSEGDRTPFIFITGQGNEEVASEAFKNGASDYFTKDIGFAHFPRIVNSVERAVKGRREQASREKAEVALREEKAKLEAILVSMGDSISIQDRDFRILYQNPAHKALIGDHVGSFCYNAYEEREETCLGCPVWEAFHDGRSHTTQRTVIKKGRPLYVEITASPLKDDSGNIIAGIEVVRDISERKEYERLLKESEEKYRLLFEDNPNPMLVYDIDTLEFLAVNNAAVAHYGYSREEFLDMTATDIRPAEEYEKFLKMAGQTKINSPKFRKTGTWKHRKKDGSIIEVQISSHSINFEGRDARVVMVDDVTEQKKAEAALFESERRLREMLENVKLIAVMLDSRGRVIFCNDFLLELTGWKKDELLGRDWFDVCLPPGTREGMRDYFYSSLARNELPPHYENPIVAKNGEERIIFWNNSLLRDECGNAVGVYSIGEDVTERKLAEKRLSDSERRYKDLVELSGDFIYLSDREGNLTFVNETAFKVFEYRPDEVIGKPWLSLLHPEDREKSVDNFENMLEEGEDSFNFENRVLSKSGKVFNLLHNIRVLRDGKGEVTGIQGIARDITLMRRAEEERSAMFHMLTHDIRGPLSVIYGYGSLASQLQGAEASKAVADIQKAAKRIYAIVDNILSLSRLESEEGGLILRPTSVPEIVEQSVRENGAAAAERGITMTVEAAPDLPRIYCDSTQLGRAVGNLVSNAVNYNCDGGSVSVRSGVAGKSEVFIEVSDTGGGIGEADLPRIFDKYYRGSESRKKKGTGLGLAIVKAVVEGHGGRVDVSTGRGKGSTFRLTLPVKPGLYR